MAASAGGDKSPEQTSGINSTATVASKPVSPPTQSTSPNSHSQTTEVQPDVTSKQLDEIDSLTFSQSVRSRKLNSSRDTSPGLVATENLTSARSSPKPVSPPTQSTCPNPRSQTTEAQPDVTGRQLDEIDTLSFSQSVRSRKLNFSRDTSPAGLVATENLTSAISSPLVATSSPPENTQASASPLTAGLVSKDSANAAGMTSPVEIHSPLVTSSSTDGSPLSADNSRRNSPGSGQVVLPCGSVKNNLQQSSSPSARVSDVDSGLSTGGGAGRLFSYLASRKLPRTPDSAPTTLSEKSVGRGRKLLAMLKGHDAAVEVGASASGSCPELTSAESRSSDEPRSKVPKPTSTNLEQMPKQILLSSGLDEDIESQAEPVDQPYPDGSHHQVLQQMVAEKLTLPKASDHHSPVREPMSPCDVNANNTASPQNVVHRHVSPTADKTQPSMRSSSSPVLAPGENFSDQLPGNHAIHTTPATQPPRDQIERSHTPLSCDSPVTLERSLGSSTDVSLCSDGLDRSSSSKMLTKRLPRIASRPGSRTGTPATPPTEKSVPDRPSCGPPSSRSTPPTTSPRGIHSRNENYDCIPEMRSVPVTRQTTVPANDRYFVIIMAARRQAIML